MVDTGIPRNANSDNKKYMAFWLAPGQIRIQGVSACEPYPSGEIAQGDIDKALNPVAMRSTALIRLPLVRGLVAFLTMAGL